MFIRTLFNQLNLIFYRRLRRYILFDLIIWLCLAAPGRFLELCNIKRFCFVDLFFSVIILISCFRLGSRSVLASLSRFPARLNSVNYAQAASNAPKITFVKFEPPKEEHHDVRNAKLNRPLSPHLTIYSFQLTAVLSITHRATGEFDLLY